MTDDFKAARDKLMDFARQHPGLFVAMCDGHDGTAFGLLDNDPRVVGRIYGRTLAVMERISCQVRDHWAASGQEGDFDAGMREGRSDHVNQRLVIQEGA